MQYIRTKHSLQARSLEATAPNNLLSTSPNFSIQIYENTDFFSTGHTLQISLQFAIFNYYNVLHIFSFQDIQIQHILLNG